jgi:hypothetical protein
MADSLLDTRMKRLSQQLKKEAARAHAKSKYAFLGPDKPVMEWTPAERNRFLRTRLKAREARSNRLMNLAIDLDMAANELDTIIFTQQSLYGRR